MMSEQKSRQLFQDIEEKKILHVPLIVDRVTDNPKRLDDLDRFEQSLREFLISQKDITSPKISFNTYMTDMRHSHMKGIIKNLNYIGSDPLILIYSSRGKWLSTVKYSLSKGGYNNVYELSESITDDLFENISKTESPTNSNNLQIDGELPKLKTACKDAEYTAQLLLDDSAR